MPLCKNGKRENNYNSGPETIIIYVELGAEMTFILIAYLDGRQVYSTVDPLGP